MRRFRRPLLAAIAPSLSIAALPWVVIAVLWGQGALSWEQAVLLAVCCLAPAMLAAAVLVRDLDRLAGTLAQAVAEADAPAVTATPRLPAVARAAEGIERLARSLAARASQLDEALRATTAIVERLPDPLLVLGADRSIRRANAAARGAFGADLAAVLRHPVLRGAIDQAWAGRTALAVDLAVPVPVARELRAAVIYLDPPLADGGQALVVLSDRTRERVVERTRADFVANASHELRTPLASLIGFIDTLRGPAADDPPAQARFLGIMAEQAARMTRLIDDLLSLSRIELTEHQPPADHVDIARLTAGVLNGFEPRLVERRIELTADLPAGLPPAIADAEQIAQVVSNLVDNAIKYGREGGTLRIAVALATPGTRWPARPGLVLSVTDDGQGIPKAQLPRLTERFYRVDRGRSRSTGGTGLGLAIVKHIVNRHRGQLAIESDEGQGATFSVWLPTAT